MASYQSCKTVSLAAGEDLRGDIYKALTIDASGHVIKTVDGTSHIVGVLAEDPAKERDTTGDAVAVAIIGGGGVLKMKAGADITAGQLIVPDDAAGRVAGAADIAALTADQMAVGVALEAAADGDVFSVLAQTIVGPTA